MRGRRARGFRGAIRAAFRCLALVAALSCAGCDELWIALGLEEKPTLEAPIFTKIARPWGDLETISLGWDWVEGAQDFQLMARDATAGGSFLQIMENSSNSFDVRGYNLSQDKLLPGHTYEFKVRARSDDAGYGPYSEVGSCRIPLYIPPTGLVAALSNDGESILLSWDPVEEADTYTVYRSASLDGYYTSQYESNRSDTAFQDTSFAPGGSYFYKVKADADDLPETAFSEACWPGSTSNLAASGSVLAGGSGLAGVTLTLAGTTSYTATTAADGSFSLASLAPGTYTLTPSLAGYAFTPASLPVELSAASVTGADFAAMALIGSTWTAYGTVISGGAGYSLAALDLAYETGADRPVAGYIALSSDLGIPASATALEYFSGGWQYVATDGNAPANFDEATPGSGRLSLAAIGDTVYLATLGPDAAYIYGAAPDGPWSADLADANFGSLADGSDRPKELRLAVRDGTLYAAQVDSGYDVKVLSYDGAAWAGVGGIGTATDGLVTTNGQAWDLAFACSGGELYVAYTEDLDDDGYNERLTIQSWSGTAWATELIWDQEYLAEILIARAGASLYFAIGTASYEDFHGGVYRVDGAAQVSLVAEAGDYGGAYSLASTASGGLYILSAVYDFSAKALVPRIYRWDGSALALLDGAYSGILAGGRILGVADRLYYVYGPSTTGTYPSSLRAAMITVP